MNFLGTPVNLRIFIFTKVPGRTFAPNLSKTICPQPRRGTQVKVHACDLQSREGLAACLRGLGEEMPPLGGVAHAAGVLDDHLIQSLGREHLWPVLGPKADPALCWIAARPFLY